MSSEETNTNNERAGSAWRWIVIVLALVTGALTTILACDDTGPSPIGNHPDDSGPPEASAPKSDGSADGEAGEEEDAESEAGEDSGPDAPSDADAAKDAPTDG